jgi:hypothetical protein
MSKEEIFQATKSVLQTLDALKNEHENILHSSEVLLSSKIDSLRKSMDMIDLGLNNNKKKHEISYFFFWNRNW